MKRIILVENYKLNIKECYSNLEKATTAYKISYWIAYTSIRRKGSFRNDDDYIITRLNIK